MERFLLNTPEYQRYYNCSTYSVDAIPIDQRRSPILGAFFMTVGIIELILYIPCMLAIQRHLENNCYKFMNVMALLDIPGIFCSAIMPGLFGCLGTVYCSAPALNYFIGMLAFFLWIWESSVEIFLAMNRCIEIGFPRLSKWLYEDWRFFWFWIFPPGVYAFYVFLFEKTPTFTGLFFAYFYNPHVGYINNMSESEQAVYQSKLLMAHNWTVAIALPGIYAIFALIFTSVTGVLKIKYCFRHDTNVGGNNSTVETGTIGTTNRFTRMHRRLFAQVILIASLNTIASILYVYMQYHEINEALIIVAQFAYSQSHGIPPLIYLTLNRTIRSDFAKISKSALKKCHCSCLIPLFFGTNNQIGTTMQTKNMNSNAPSVPCAVMSKNVENRNMRSAERFKETSY